MSEIIYTIERDQTHIAVIIEYHINGEDIDWHLRDLDEIWIWNNAGDEGRELHLDTEHSQKEWLAELTRELTDDERGEITEAIEASEQSLADSFDAEERFGHLTDTSV